MWTSFMDLFRACVDSNTQLANSEKLNDLRARIKGDARYESIKNSYDH